MISHAKCAGSRSRPASTVRTAGYGFARQSIRLTDCVSDLSQAVDVYSDWVDACDAVAKDAADSTAKSGGNTYAAASSRAQPGRGGGTNAEVDDFIEDDDLDAEAEYGDD